MDPSLGEGEFEGEEKAGEVRGEDGEVDMELTEPL
jgi:hypothetical protein